MSVFRYAQPGYPEEDIRPMREEVEVLGVKSLRTAADVDAALANQKGTALVFVNSVCGCAAGGARPGIAAALQNAAIPDALYTVFAGVDREATQRARDFIKGFAPSSPSAALFKDGQVVFMLERHMVEGHMPEEIAATLIAAFNKHCSAAGPSIPAEKFGSLRFVQVCGSQLAEKAKKLAAAGR